MSANITKRRKSLSPHIENPSKSKHWGKFQIKNKLHPPHHQTFSETTRRNAAQIALSSKTQGRIELFSSRARHQASRMPRLPTHFLKRGIFATCAHLPGPSIKGENEHRTKEKRESLSRLTTHLKKGQKIISSRSSRGKGKQVSPRGRPIATLLISFLFFPPSPFYCYI